MQGDYMDGAGPQKKCWLIPQENFKLKCIHLKKDNSKTINNSNQEAERRKNQSAWWSAKIKQADRRK